MIKERELSYYQKEFMDKLVNGDLNGDLNVIMAPFGIGKPIKTPVVKDKSKYLLIG